MGARNVSDESPFTVCFKMKKGVWRLLNDRYIVECLAATVKHDVRINVWGAFSATGVGILRLIDAIMDGEYYREILSHEMLGSLGKLFGNEECIFQQDNDPKHTANLIKQWFRDHNITIVDWPSQSPDLNRIEDLWSILDRNMRYWRVNTAAELLEEIQRAWEALDPDLLHSMPARIAAVIAKGGMPTKY